MVKFTLVVAERLCVKAKKLSTLVKDRMNAYPSPGEINRKVEDADAVISNVLSVYQKDAILVDYTDGISLDMGLWRFNLCKSNTEPLIRLNLETRGDRELMSQKTSELLSLIR